MIRPTDENTSYFWTVLKALPNEDVAVRQFTKIRWRLGQFCPYCKHQTIYHLTKPKMHKCAGCKLSFSITVGTIFQGTKLPLRVWILAIAHLSECGGRVGSTELATRLDLSQKTAWYMLERLRRAALTLSFKRSLATVKSSEGKKQSYRPKGDLSFRWRDAADRMEQQSTIEWDHAPTRKRKSDVAKRTPRPSAPTVFMISGDHAQNAAVERVLKQLHRRRDLAGGMGHPSDAGRAVELFRPLVERGYRIAPDACHLWALAHGWDDGDAVELAAGIESLNWETP